MSANLPAPLTARECDLRGMPYMPLDIVRLFDSDMYALSTGDEFKAALSLWAKSFLQVPAASLPTDERLLAFLSGAGPNWSSVREMALRGWVLCSDGRLYHPVVAEKAAEAWQARLARRARTEAARAARNSGRTGPTGGGGATPQTAQNETRRPVTASVTEHVTGSKGREVKGEVQGESKTPPYVDVTPGDSRASARDDDDPPKIVPIRPSRQDWSPPEGAVATEDEMAAVDAWNALAAREPNLHRAVRDQMDSSRIRELRAALGRVGGLTGWIGLLAKIERSPFWRGETGRKVGRRTLGHVLEPDTLTKLLEGFYDEWKANPAKSRQPQYTPESYINGVREAAGVKVPDDQGGDFLDGSFLKQGLIG